MRIDSPPPSPRDGIVLRQLERTDLDAWFSYLQIPEVVEHTSWNLHSRDDLLPLFLGYESNTATSPRRLAIVDQGSAELAGTIGFHTISDVNQSAEITYDLSPAYWGHGIASAVCDRVTHWSFTNYGFVRVQATVLDTNARSERVLGRCRYNYEGLLRAYRMVRGRTGDFKMFARLSTGS